MENKKAKNKKQNKKRRREKDFRSIDLLDKRIIYLDGEITEESAKRTIETLLKLDIINHKDIKMYINSEGGSVNAGLAIIDTMNSIKSDVSTICLGRAASMGAILLINGTKGKRCIGTYSEIMIHEVATYGGNYGKVSEQHDKLKRTTYVNRKIQRIIASKTNMSLKDVQKDTKKKDTWINSKNALKYGFVDRVLSCEQKI